MATAVLIFGRMAPVTVGHRRLVEKALRVAEERKADAFLYVSKSYDGKDSVRKRRGHSKNPLKYKDKIFFVRQAFGSMIAMPENSCRTAFEVLDLLWAQGYTSLVLVGDDNFIALPVEKYNGKTYNFTSVERISGGVRDEKSRNFAATVSATQARKAVQAQDYATFASLIAPAVDVKKLWHILQDEMQLGEQA